MLGTFTDALAAQEWLAANMVDLLFLDIQMPDINGMQLFQSLEDKPLVIFTTAFSHYAVEGFNLDAVDYLVKPFDFDRFAKAVTKARELLEYRSGKDKNNGFLFVKYDYQWNKINYNDIELIEALDDYVKIYLPGKPALVHISMKALSEKLPEELFLRVHRSYIVPVAKIKGWNKNNISLQIQTVPVSSTYQQHVQDVLEKMNN